MCFSLLKIRQISKNPDNKMSNFGPEFDRIWPKANATFKMTDFGKKLLQQCETLSKPDPACVNIERFMQKSAAFPGEFPIRTCRVMSQPRERYPIIEQQIASAYPVIHERVLALYLAFLEHKCKYGNKIELKIYGNMSLAALVQRLLSKRCVAFVGPSDYYRLLNGKEGRGGFREVGTKSESEPLTLQNVLSYDEMKLSAFLSVSSHTEFINNGTRRNAGVVEHDKSKIETDGVVIGLIGSRFHAEGMMEWQDIMITEAQNTKHNGYGLNESDVRRQANRSADYRQLWRDFYEEPDFTYDAVKQLNTPRFYHIPNHTFIFDNLAMKKRFTVSFDTLLLEAEARGAAAQRQVYVHVVGIGLGVWRAVEYQEQVFLEAFTQRLLALLDKLQHVSVVHFSWFGTDQWGQLKDGGKFSSEAHPNGGITTLLSNRNPAEKLSAEYQNMLMVVSYAWDSNALPGNEFWNRSLTSSSDPAAASSTLITELHNAHINTDMVSGENLHVASAKYGVLHISDYAKKILY